MNDFLALTPVQQKIALIKRRKELAQKDTEFMQQQVAEKSFVKNITPVRLDEAHEDEVIHDFLFMPAANPSVYTLAMEGRPAAMDVRMSNGLTYRAYMAKMVYVEWPGGLDEFIRQNRDKKKNWQTPKEMPVSPIVMLDEIHYKLILYPYHLDGQTHPEDYQEISWHERDRVERDFLRGFVFPFGPSFKKLSDEQFSILLHPPHMRKMYKEIQQTYHKLVKQGLGYPIYTVMDPTKPPRGEGHTFSFDFRLMGSQSTRKSFYVPDIRYVNPNRKPALENQGIAFPKLLRRER